MARLFGLIGNRADLAGRVLGSERDALMVHARNGGQLGWGMGFYQGGEVLMRRRPIDDHAAIDVAKIAGDVRTDLLLGHVRSATVGSVRTENTHPFRYRQWLFAQTGTLPSFEAIRERLVASVPEFLRSSIRGETDAELLFYVFLSFLHDAGRLTEALMPVAHVRDALRSSVAVVDGMAAEVGGEPSQVNLLASDGENVYVLHRGAQMGYRVFSGKVDADALIGEDLGLRRKTPELAQMHFTLIAADFDDEWSLASSSPAGHSRWSVVPERAIVTIERGREPHVEPL
jgi:predicted glutamine amidotransferase